MRSRQEVLAIAAVRGAPSGAFAVRLLRSAIRRHGPPRWLVTDKDPVLRSDLVQRLLTAHGILRRYGAVGRKGSIALIERTWRSMKDEYVRRIFRHRPRTSRAPCSPCCPRIRPTPCRMSVSFPWQSA